MEKTDLKKLIIPVILILCLIVPAGGIIYALSQAPEKTPDNPINGMSDSYSKVLYTGSGYHTKDIQMKKTGETAKVEAEVLEEKPKDKKTKETKDKDADKESKKKDKEDKDDDSSDPDTENYDDGDEGDPVNHPEDGDDDDDQEGADKPEEDDPNEGKYPIIASDLEDGEVIHQSYRTFFVRVTDYKGRYISASSVVVTVIPAGGSSKKLYSTNDDGYKIGYKLNMEADSYTVTIKATDKKGLSSIATYTVKKGEGGEPEVEGQITFSLEATTVGLGKLIGPTKVDFYQGEQLTYVLDRALKEHGYSYRYQGDLERGFYLKHVVRSGITDGADIPSDLLEKLEDAGYTPTNYHQDSLGEYDFSGQSGWIYSVNGANMSSGMASFYPADGDEVRLRFSLYKGYDLDGHFGKIW